MPIEFLCPGCRQLLQTPDDTAGMQATCPHCGQTMLVPGGEPPPSALPMHPPASGVSGPGETPGSGSHHEANQLIPPPGAEPESGSGSDSAAVVPPPGSGLGSGAGSGFVPGGSSVVSGSGSSLEREVPESNLATDQAPSLGTPPAVEQPANIALPETETEPAPFAPPPPFQYDEDHLGSPAPDRFAIYPALAYGWEIMKANFNAFFVGAVLFGMASVFVLPLPFMIAGLGALAVRAARGMHPEIGVSLEGFNDMGSTLTKMGLWLGLTLVVHAPLVGFWLFLNWSGIPGLRVLGMLVMLAGGILYGVRLGWVPFAVLERPHLNFSQLINHSLEISKDRTWELIQLAGLSYCAILATIWGFCVGIVFFGIPIALGIGGSTYVLLTREAGK